MRIIVTMTPARGLVALAAAVFAVGFSGCGGGEKAPSERDQVRTVVRAQIEEIKAEFAKCSYLLDPIDRPTGTRGAKHGDGCDRTWYPIDIGKYTIDSVGMDGKNRGYAIVTFVRTDPNWGTRTEREYWYAKKVDGTWKAEPHEFGI